MKDFATWRLQPPKMFFITLHPFINLPPPIGSPMWPRMSMKDFATWRLQPPKMLFIILQPFINQNQGLSTRAADGQPGFPILNAWFKVPKLKYLGWRRPIWIPKPEHLAQMHKLKQTQVRGLST